MKVFVTGASGLVGSNLIPQLVAAGHEVTALARSDSSAEKIKANGASHIVRGTNEDYDLLTKTARSVDAVVQLAFDHDIAFQPGGMEVAAGKELKAVEALANGLHKGGYIIVASGLFGNAGPTEDSEKAGFFSSGRGETELYVRSLAKKGLHSYVYRLPPVCHSDDREHPFIGIQAAKAKEVGYAVYVGEGKNVWQAAHVLDACALIVLTLKGGAPPGSALHIAGEDGITTKAIVETIAKKLGVETRSVDAKTAGEHLGFIGMLLTLDCPISTKLTKQWTGWKPKEIGLLEEIEKNYSFSA